MKEEESTIEGILRIRKETYISKICQVYIAETQNQIDGPIDTVYEVVAVQEAEH